MVFITLKYRMIKHVDTDIQITRRTTVYACFAITTATTMGDGAKKIVELVKGA